MSYFLKQMFECTDRQRPCVPTLLHGLRDKIKLEKQRKQDRHGIHLLFVEKEEMPAEPAGIVSERIRPGIFQNGHSGCIITTDIFSVWISSRGIFHLNKNISASHFY